MPDPAIRLHVFHYDNRGDPQAVNSQLAMRLHS